MWQLEKLKWRVALIIRFLLDSAEPLAILFPSWLITIFEDFSD